jgi:ureidoglycolate hydrolase
VKVDVREVVLTEGMDLHVLYFFPCTTLAFLPVVEEKFLVADVFAIP